MQHYPATNRKYNTADLNHESGFTALAFIVTAPRFEELKLSSSVEDVGKNYPEYNSSILECKNPDGTSVLVKVSYELICPMCACCPSARFGSREACIRSELKLDWKS